MTDEEADETDGESPLGAIVQGAKWVMGGRIVKMAVVFLTQIVVARILGTTFFGGLAQAQAIAGIAGLIGTLGLGSGVTRQLAYYEDEPEKARGVFRAGIVLGLLSTTAAGVLLYVYAPFVATEVFQDETLIPLLRVMAFGVPIGFLTPIGVGMGKASRDASVHTYINQIGQPVTNSVLKAGAAILGFGVTGVVAGIVAAKALVGVVALYLGIKAMPFSLRGASQSMSRDLFTFSFPLLFSASFNFLIGDIDTFLLGILRDSADVGIYTAAFGLRPMILVFFFPATFLLPSVLTRLQKEERPRELRRTYAAISKWTSLVSFPLFLLPFLFPTIVLGVAYTAEYVTPASATAMRVLSGAMLVNFLLGANDRAVVALGHNRATMAVAAVAATINVVLNVALIPEMGIVGAAVASAIAFGSRDVINTTLLYRWHGLSPVTRGVGRVFGVMLVLVPVGYVGFTTYAPVSFLTVTAVGLVFLALYVPIMIRLGVEGSLDYELFQIVEDTQGVDLDPLRDVIAQIR